MSRHICYTTLTTFATLVLLRTRERNPVSHPRVRFSPHTQGKEPNHFMSIFKTPLIITSGGYSRKAGKEVGMTEVALYQVRPRLVTTRKILNFHTHFSYTVSIEKGKHLLKNYTFAIVYA